ncbi:hypothetical protein D0C36_17250 [Mucilaginibacter conchicola]|uniref:Uncharacterized protein n=1 Tax=Mucilaginibacter conchicola TaxID=2303333 RepID=A0A372NQ01_9SPHI|nr:hypothetical protein [Mucilaginibacter conchicola]RFZ90707.1 hypothetical protein D0C36_17250 [Mucilaginibacter conchicola]
MKHLNKIFLVPLIIVFIWELILLWQHKLELRSGNFEMLLLLGAILLFKQRGLNILMAILGIYLLIDSVGNVIVAERYPSLNIQLTFVSSIVLLAMISVKRHKQHILFLLTAVYALFNIIYFGRYWSSPIKTDFTSGIYFSDEMSKSLRFFFQVLPCYYYLIAIVVISIVLIKNAMAYPKQHSKSIDQAKI